MDNLDYGIVGNCRSAALISKDGAIEWFCLPEFDSSSEFAKILDREKGGEFGFDVGDGYTITQKYHENTNILVTRFEKGDDRFELIDFMPRYHNDDGDYYSPPDLIRYLHHISGNPVIRIVYDPKLDYAGPETKTDITPEYLKSYTLGGNYESIYLYSDLPLDRIASREEITLDRDAFLYLSYNEKLSAPTLEHVNLELQRTEVYWLDWVERGMGLGAYCPEIVRSALVLRLLTFSPTGSVIAAPTTSLPETIGEERNWDYRYCWIRDASMIINVMHRLHYWTEAKEFLDFIISLVRTKDERIQIMYGIHGERTLTEHRLNHLSGYQNSTPVRVGNAAFTQRQHDIVGVLMDVIYHGFLHYRITPEKREELWTITRFIMKKITAHCQFPDKGIWEIRGEEKHFVFSKVLTWVGADRGIKIARLLGREKYIDEWTALRDMIYNDIMTKGWNEELGAFTQAYENDDMDAANLLIAYYGFIEATDPKYISTVKRIKKELLRDGLMYRYKNEDDFGIPSSSFTVCTFWMIQALFKIGEKEEAKELFEKLLTYSNHLGLFSEDIDFKTKRLLGNFPQGYSHLALIETAILLQECPPEEPGKMSPFIISST